MGDSSEKDTRAHTFINLSSRTGNGKIKVKEPTELAETAMKQLSQAIDMAKSSATN